MSNKLMVEGAPGANVVPPSAEVQGVMAASQDPRAEAMAGTAIEEIMRTDPAAAFEWPAGMTGKNGVTYTPPSGDA